MTKYSEGERAILTQAADMKDLLRSPGWKTLENSLNQMLMERNSQILNDINGVSDFITQERIKGSIITLRAILSLPQGIISHADLIRADHVNTSGEDE